MFYKRFISNKIHEHLSTFSIVTILGASGCGKTTLVKKEFQNYKYISLEIPEIREIALNDPKRFVELYNDKVILDNVQRVPQLFSYIQTHVDIINKPGIYVLIGSYNLIANELYSKYLSSKSSILILSSLSTAEMNKAEILGDVNDLLYRGTYPSVYCENQNPKKFYSSYMNAFIERDLKMIRNVTNINLFERFLYLLANHCTDLLNASELSKQIGVSRVTIDSWIKTLEDSYIIFKLEPYYKNNSKRYVKKSKLYFYDTGLVTYLLGIKSQKEIEKSNMREALFENLIISEAMKCKLHNENNSSLYFYKDSNAIEVKLIEENELSIKLYDIKQSSTVLESHWKQINKVAKLLGVDKTNTFVVYLGSDILESDSYGNYMSYRSFQL